MTIMVKDKYVFLFCLIFFLEFSAPHLFAYEPDLTNQHIQKKAIITTHNAKLFENFIGIVGNDIGFMQILFIMKPAMGDRTPVSLTSNKSGEPDGWLNKSSYIEWNTIHMIKFEPQTGRKRVRVFKEKLCAELFSIGGNIPENCVQLGVEPLKNISKTDCQFLTPVFQTDEAVYKAGFIRVFNGPDSTKKDKIEVTSPKESHIPEMGYDICFAIDRTSSMLDYNFPFAEIIQAFVKNIEREQEFNGINVKKTLRMGVLYYQDRLIEKNSCLESFPVTEWAIELTHDIDSVIEVLREFKPSACSSEEPAEAVFDGLNRILIDTEWNDNALRTIVLIGDAPPHQEDHPKNPFHLNCSNITKEADNKSIRFITIKIGEYDPDFRDLASNRPAQNKGRYKRIPSNSSAEFYKRSLFDPLLKEWRVLVKGTKIIRDKVPIKSFLNDDQYSKRLSPYTSLIIQTKILSSSSAKSRSLPEFVQGWIPEQINNQMAVNVFLFIEKSRLIMLINILEGLSTAADIGITYGPTAFITITRTTISSQLGITETTQIQEVFSYAETLSNKLEKEGVLPLRSKILNFTVKEVETWNTSNYQRIKTILQEKAKIMREFCSNPGNFRYFGDKPYFYIPRQIFP